MYFFSSSILPITMCLPEDSCPVPSFALVLGVQIGKGDAQKRFRLIAQSGAFSKISKTRPCFKCAGIQFIFSLESISCFFIFWTSINQDERALYIRGVSHL